MSLRCGISSSNRGSGVSSLLFVIVVLIFCAGSLGKAAANADSGEEGFVKEDSRKIQVLMRPQWGRTPLALEAAEFFFDNKAHFWEFVEKFQPQKTDKAEYDHILDLSRDLFKSYSKKVSGLAEKLFKWGLSLRYYSPLVASFHQTANETWFENTGEYIQLKKSKECPVWFVVDGKKSVQCEIEHLVNSIQNGYVHNADLFRQTIYKSDHVYGNFVEGRLTVILHGSILDPEFQGNHEILKSLADSEQINYVLRPFDWSHFSSPPILLQGYGIELAIKNTEYPVIDDSFSPDKSVPYEYKGSPIDSKDETNLEKFLFDIVSENWPKKKHEFIELFRNQTYRDLEQDKMKFLGTQTMQAIIKSSDPLHSLQTISQNYPSLATVLTNIPPDMPLHSLFFHHQSVFGDGNNYLLLNGRNMDLDDMNPHRLYSLLLSEFGFLRKLDATGISAKILPLISSKIHELKEKPFAYRVDARSDAVIFLNDLENDGAYSRWPKTVKELLRPSMMGMPHFIAKNLYTIVFVFNPLDEGNLELYGELYQHVSRSAPLRFGVVFYVPGQNESPHLKELCQTIDNTFRYLSKAVGPSALALFEGIWHHGRSSENEEITLDTISRGYDFVKKNVARGKSLRPFSDFLDSPDNSETESAESFVKRVNIQSFPTMFFNGQPFSGYSAFGFINSLFFKEESILTKFVESEELTDKKNPYNFIMSQPGVFSKINSRIIPSSDAAHLTPFVSLVDELRDTKATHREDGSKTALVGSLAYVENNEENKTPKYLSVFVCSDLIEKDSVSSALLSLNELDTNTRLAFLPLSGLAAPSSRLQKILNILNSEERIKFAKEYLTIANESSDFQVSVEEFSKLLQSYNVDESVVNQGDIDRKLSELSHFCSKHTGSSPFSVIVNGRVLSIKRGEPFEGGDFKMLQLFEFESRSKHMKDAVTQFWTTNRIDQPSTEHVSDIIMYLTSTVWSSDFGNRENLAADENHDVMYVSLGNVGLSLTGIINPLSRYAQKASQILMLFRDYFDADIKVFWNPSMNIAEKPLKSFYRFVVQHELQFDKNGKLSYNQVATFEGLPEHKTLTLNIDVMEAWMVGIQETKYDLDNIVLKDLPAGVRTLTTALELENILITGRCYDQFQQPPRGLQLILGTKSQPHIRDTTVMANLGYFQLQSNPGVYKLDPAPGRSTEFYDISVFGESAIVSRDSTSKQNVHLAVTSFLGLDFRLHAEKKSDKLKQDLLDDAPVAQDKRQESVWGVLGSLFSKSEAGNATETIHIFSVASGHLYERFLRIMMYSVTKNTKNPVKFWILKNYLSPRFKHYLPEFAKKFNFSYELITYKWPHFLNKQTEKHRVIWGSKVLFLDVLFPLDVQKIIFVDADQVARSDLSELYFMDIQEKPLAYTPFCRSRPDMNGYQFWTGGFWASHLQGKPYHISALYVVDLQRFRKMAAGDRFRITYEQLSRDPNSLANLDQDLPNYMQHQVPIYSLPQEWLWCESWCSDGEKPKAKTIDLCNNPATKEPKLDSAKRIIGEWTEYDNTLTELERRITE